MTPNDIPRFEQLKASGQLPSPKGVALAILRLTQKEDASMAEMARIIKSDPAFVGRVIKAANSAKASPGRPVVSVQESLVVLGMPAVRNLALGLSLLSQYRQGNCEDFDYKRFWSASLAGGIALQGLSRHVRAIQPEEAFSLGLLARIGELAMATLYSEEYARLLRATARSGYRELARLERETFAITHCELTAAMLADWGMPPVFAAIARRLEDGDGHGFAEGSREERLLRLLVMARAIADLCLAGERERMTHRTRVSGLGDLLGIDAEELGGLCDRVVAEWRDWAGMLNVVSQPLPPFDEMAAGAVAAGQAVATEGLPAMRLMLVDADPAIRQALHELRDAAGLKIGEADGAAALRLALQDEPQMLVVAGEAGLALVRALRETRPGRAIYIIVLTPSGDEQHCVEALDAGADDILAMPPSPRLLLARLRAGRRVIELQQEIERDREELRRYAAELSVTNRRLQEMALTDVLTGLPNRRYAMERIEQEWAGAVRGNRPLACMIVDLDELKQVNDIYGHDMGDEFLAQTSAAIRRALRAQDVICRTGGDEFLVICPDSELDAALACAERVRREVEAKPVEAGQLRIRGTLSIGVAARLQDMEDADALIKQADQGVYLAKQRGRNRAVTVQGGSRAGA
ncbi:MAG: diguanylate cyclase [Rhodocyclaceae bacterium]|nr:MAG: diguanylate cyclase [Rhodocyclaceae bacterium]MBE7421434.1 diguanylate cyclase [Zoogloeaceae bacterium]MCK6385318.1 diguanylate cyclase [Rhodocyclaceae bacterium]CAG0945928.1 Response regulator PleD [Gammaproteobacteria bacterium]